MDLFACIIISIIGVVWVNVGFCKYNHKPILTHVALLYFFSGFKIDDRCLSFMCCRNNPNGRAASLRFHSETSHIAKQKTAPKKQQQPQLFFNALCSLFSFKTHKWQLCGDYVTPAIFTIFFFCVPSWPVFQNLSLPVLCDASTGRQPTSSLSIQRHPSPTSNFHKSNSLKLCKLWRSLEPPFPNKLDSHDQ